MHHARRKQSKSNETKTKQTTKQTKAPKIENVLKLSQLHEIIFNYKGQSLLNIFKIFNTALFKITDELMFWQSRISSFLL